jgi:hypothetical protein
MVCLAFPFIGQGKDPGYTTEREKEEKKKEKKQRRRQPQAYAALLLRGCVLQVLQMTMKVCACCGYVHLWRYRRSSPSWT